MSGDVLTKLVETIRARRDAPGDVSYTRQLLDRGVERCAKKFGEEAVEAVIAATSQSEEELRAESADVLYHLLVLLESRNVAFADVLSELEKRTNKSGLEEKAARGK
ncbi:MAG: phosphoribosyl-ATP diphosphatase [Hyphomicrobiaceae bacterium]|nr:phosphoribosyl-ATP diphosphatase [Hyphomicrobiaceae bacterium]